MDSLSFGIAMGQKYRAEGAEEGLASALEACKIYKTKIAALHEELLIEQANSAALKAVVEEFKARHADSPLLAVIGKRRDGQPLRLSTSIWMKVFDATAIAVGLRNPEQHRIS